MTNPNSNSNLDTARSLTLALRRLAEEAPRVVTLTLNAAIDHTIGIPNFAPNAVHRVAWERLSAGGKGVNVASFLADVGIRVTATGWLGADNDEVFRSFFERKGIRDRFVRVPGRTRANVKIVDEPRQQITDVNFPGVEVGPQALEALRAAFEELVRDHEWFVLSGSLPPGAPVDLYARWLRRLKRQGARVVLDTSGDPLRAALTEGPAMAKPNLMELEGAMGKQLASVSEIVAGARALIAGGIEVVVVSRGADGALFVAADATHEALPMGDLPVRSTVGAGDALVAGWVAARLARLAPEETARLATAFACTAISQIGERRLVPDALVTTACQVTVRSFQAEPGNGIRPRRR